MVEADATPVQVLVVGPDESALLFMEALLTRAGLLPSVAPSERAAAITNATPPGVVVVDRDLQAVRSVRALADPKKAAVPIVVLGSVGASSAEAAGALDAGATHYFERPIAEPDLIAGLRSILGD